MVKIRLLLILASGHTGSRRTKKFASELLEKLYHEEKNNKIVVYITSMAMIRKTYEDCKVVLKIFETLNKKILVKDIHLDGTQFQKELKERLPSCFDR